MALINCPHCGKQISDKSSVCVHCGGRIGAEPPQLKKYTSLTNEEKYQLEDEFYYKLHPKYGKMIGRRASIKYLKSKSSLAVLFVWVVWAITLAARYLRDFIEFPLNNVLFLLAIAVSFIILLVLFIAMIASSIMLYKTHNRLIIAIKRFQKWLYDEKQIIYEPSFKSRRFRTYFDNLNLKLTDY